MKKIATVTFHGSYNFGSVLQTYALQRFVTELANKNAVDVDYRVINYRPERQKELYWQKRPKMTKTNLIKGLMRFPYRKKLKKQAAAFEDFLRERIRMTEEVDDAGLTRFAESFDYYISGSDQIFNIRSRDFSFAYLLNFTQCPNKLSYAASLGPLQIDWSKYDEQTYLELLRQYKAVSVREKRSKEMVDALLGTTQSEIHIDPTLLLAADEWRTVQSERNYNNGKYIFFYCLEPTKAHMETAHQLSKALGLPVVCTGYRCKHDYFNSFVKLYDTGPADFLSLIDHAAIVLTSSFHGTAFSVIYNKPFWVIDGMNDNRIRNLLTMTGLTDNSIPLSQEADFIGKQPKRAEDGNAADALQKEITRSAGYLLRALDLEECSK